MYLTVMV
jgi:hypothetical protein